MRGLLEVVRLGEVDVRDIGLRIAIDEREPSALNLDHQTMSLLKAVQYVE